MVETVEIGKKEFEKKDNGIHMKVPLWFEKTYSKEGLLQLKSNLQMQLAEVEELLEKCAELEV